MKIYYILNDSIPYNNKLKDYLTTRNLHSFTQISNCFTTTSAISLLTGKLPSDLEYNGIGYGNNNSETWMDKTSIVNLYQMGFDIHFHNASWFYSTICNDDFIIKSTSMPCEVKNEEKFRKTKNYGELLLTKDSSYYENEKKFIKKIQNEKDNKFYFIKNNQYHQAIIGKNDKEKSLDLIVDWFKNWDFNEPNSLFVIFSDHHDFTMIDKLCQPPSVLTWSFVRDNYYNFDIKKNYIHISDFYNIKSLQEQQDKERIYFSEDARQRVDTNNSTTAIACKFIDWEKDKANKIEQVSYFKPEDKFYGFIYNLNTTKVEIVNPNKQLINKIYRRFSWVQ